MANRTCSVEGCGGPVWARGWCGKHYQKWQRYGDPLGSAPERPVRLCDYPGCGRKHKSGGYCMAHWNQVREGRPLQPLRPRGAQRIYTLNHAYFDEITDEHRAYWLGFITADGNVRRPDGRCILRISLKASDGGHLQALCRDLGSDRPLLFSRGDAMVTFNSGQLVEALGLCGVTPRKTATAQPWSGPAELMPHYWRGLFDGDGCLHKQSHNRKWTLNIVGSEACVTGFADWAREATGSSARVRPLAGCYGWAVGGTVKPQLLARALYEGASIALPRKQDLAERLMASDFGPTR